MKTVKKAFITVHRWFGLALSLLFVAWFGSGVVMMFVDGMPSLNAQPQFWLRKPLLDFGAARFGPGDAVAGVHPRPRGVELGMLEGRPVYRMRSAHGSVCVFADDGNRLAPISPGRALAIARMWTGSQYPLEPPQTIADDQWTVGDGFGALKPLYKIRVDDGAGTDVYVSAATGEVVQAVNTRQRFWGYLGPVTHWLYFTPLRRQEGTWAGLVIGLSALGSLLCLSGLVAGVWQFAWRRLRSPYAKFWLSWHHVLGMAFGLIGFTWVFSGMLSMDPFGSHNDTGPARARLAGGPLDADGFELEPQAALRSLSGFGTKTLKLVQVAGRPYYLAYADASHSRLVPADAPEAAPLERLDSATLIQDFKTEFPEMKIASAQMMAAYDAYYYSKRQSRPLPALKITVDDREKTVFYLDPSSGGVVLRLGNWGRANRWLYSGLHRWDFPGLIGSLKLWTATVLPFMLAGLALSLTGLVLSWQWLRKKAGL